MKSVICLKRLSVIGKPKFLVRLILPFIILKTLYGRSYITAIFRCLMLELKISYISPKRAEYQKISDTHVRRLTFCCTFQADKSYSKVANRNYNIDYMSITEYL